MARGEGGPKLLYTRKITKFYILHIELLRLKTTQFRCAIGAVTVFGGHSRIILRLVTPHFVQAAFGHKNCQRRLKFCMQHLNVIIYTNQEHNLGSEVNDLHYDFHKL